MVAERSVNRGSFLEKGGGIRSENADISNDKPEPSFKRPGRILVAVSPRVSIVKFDFID